VVFSPGEAYLTFARFTGAASRTAASDYTGTEPYFRSVQRIGRAGPGGGTDRLTMHDYLWRWDTDWFWCSGAFGLHDPKVRRVWPRRWRRSDVYHRLIGLDQKVGFSAWRDRRQGIARERVIQDVEVPVGRTREFVEWFDREVGMRPVWLCPLRLRGSAGPDGAARTWPSYPLAPSTTYVNVGFWGTVPIREGRRDGDVNRLVETKVSELGGHKSLYSDAYYDRETFDALYDTANLEAVRREHDPDGRLTGLYEKAVRAS
jgi:FAD/FMN-containing dehydrogenase